jgi:dethiobiotin synthetase
MYFGGKSLEEALGKAPNLDRQLVEGAGYVYVCTCDIAVVFNLFVLIVAVVTLEHICHVLLTILIGRGADVSRFGNARNAGFL